MKPTGRAGLTLVELVIAITVATLAVVGFGGVLVSIQKQYEQSSLRNLVLDRAASVMEEIRAEAPSTIINYDGTTHPVTGVVGNFTNNDAITVTVDDSNPLLIVVTVDASWMALGNVETLQLQTEIYDG